MNRPTLASLDVTNFRSIRGHVHAPLDARVVLVHGENGAGKTSLLSAIELALTGGVQSLRRADPAYARQLLHRSADQGGVALATTGDGGGRYEAALTPTGAKSINKLDAADASFFTERSYLPQSLLSQLLQIYQDAGQEANSPLARFVGDLLGLNLLDAIEEGLKPLADKRNVRKIAGEWATAELRQSQAERSLRADAEARALLQEQIDLKLADLRGALAILGVDLPADEASLDAIEPTLAEPSDAADLERLADSRRQLASMRRQVAEENAAGTGPDASAGAGAAAEAFSRWVAANGEREATLLRDVAIALPEANLPSETGRFVDAARTAARARRTQAQAQATQARADARRLLEAEGELETERGRLAAIDNEVARLPGKAGGLASALAELTSFIEGETCPVCDRDYREVSDAPLVEHVHAKVRTLSASAERLLALGRARGEAASAGERRVREIEELRARRVEAPALAAVDRLGAELDALIARLDEMEPTVLEGARLRAADVAARRAAAERGLRDSSLAAARDMVASFAASLDLDSTDVELDLTGVVDRIGAALAEREARLKARLAARNAAREAVAAIRAATTRRAVFEQVIETGKAEVGRAADALRRAQRVRDRGIAVRGAVERVRSGIIRREFNDRLNRLWRDLFVRLAPGEPFVPAFSIPTASTHRLQPKLVTVHRDGGLAGGTPGAMLSAGNLNTAALTLFVALHLSVRDRLPWLILDDPIQSMDDIHVAHFAALLRTLSKEHGRQVLIAVHDRQLFDYLRLELSPAFPDDSLLTLELTRGPRRDTRCLSERFGYKEEALLAAA